ncbi:MAG: hypothetical protein JO121_22400 [Deltaproteobacteria bacterium]|nr:hypothetical protein [Deltaproteobacteria bacterium]
MNLQEEMARLDREREEFYKFRDEMRLAEQRRFQARLWVPALTMIISIIAIGISVGVIVSYLIPRR